MLVNNFEFVSIGCFFFLQGFENISDIGYGIPKNTTNDQSNKNNKHSFIISDRNYISVANS